MMAPTDPKLLSKLPRLKDNMFPILKAAMFPIPKEPMFPRLKAAMLTTNKENMFQTIWKSHMTMDLTKEKHFAS